MSENRRCCAQPSCCKFVPDAVCHKCEKDAILMLKGSWSRHLSEHLGGVIRLTVRAAGIPGQFS